MADCSSLRSPLGEEGFEWFDGTVPTVSQGDFYVLRYEYPGEFVTDSPRWMKGRQRWHFVEVRQLKDSVTVVDGVEMENCCNPNEPIPTSEQIELQCHGDPIEFRNMFIREQ